MDVIPVSECKTCEEGELVYEYHNGYPRIRTWPNGGEFPVHRLTAVSHYGFEAVKDMEIHHLNGRKFDGRACNLVPLTSSEHSRVEYAQDCHKHTG